jgi:hypothetical protein
MRELVKVVGSAIGVLAGGLLLALVLYLAVVVGAVLLGMVLVVLLAKAAARLIP